MKNKVLPLALEQFHAYGRVGPVQHWVGKYSRTAPSARVGPPSPGAVAQEGRGSRKLEHCENILLLILL